MFSKNVQNSGLYKWNQPKYWIIFIMYIYLKNIIAFCKNLKICKYCISLSLSFLYMKLIFRIRLLMKHFIHLSRKLIYIKKILTTQLPWFRLSIFAWTESSYQVKLSPNLFLFLFFIFFGGGGGLLFSLIQIPYKL